MRRLILSILVIFAVTGLSLSAISAQTATPTPSRTPTATPGDGYCYSYVNFDETSPLTYTMQLRGGSDGSFPGTPSNVSGIGVGGTNASRITVGSGTAFISIVVEVPAGLTIAGWGAWTAATSGWGVADVYSRYRQSGSWTSLTNIGDPGAGGLGYSYYGSGLSLTNVDRVSLEVHRAAGAASVWMDDFNIKFLCPPTPSATPTNTPVPINASFTASPSSGYPSLEVEIDNNSTGEILSYSWKILDDDYPCSFTTSIYSTSSSPPPYTFTEPGGYLICLTITGEGGTSDTDQQTITVFDGSPGVQTLTQPLSAEDFNGDVSQETTINGMYDGVFFEQEAGQDLTFSFEDENTVGALSNKQNAPVMAVGDGEVIAVIPLTQSDCNVIFSRSDITCSLPIPQEIMGSALPFHAFNVKLNYAYRVLVAYELQPDTYIEYVVFSPTVSVGDIISEGCVLGYTIDLFGAVDTPITVGGNLDGLGGSVTFQPVTGFSIVILTAYQSEDDLSENSAYTPRESLRLLPALVVQRIPSTLCSQNPVYSSCVSDGELANSWQWEQDGLVLWDADGRGATLHPGASISQQLVLETGEEYGADINADPELQIQSSIDVTLGLTTITQNLTKPKFVTSIPPDEHDPDAGLYYTFRIANTGQSPVHISRACVSQASGNGIGLPVSGSCSVANFAFNEGGAGWTLTDANADISPGLVYIASTGQIEQTVYLAAGDYTITLGARAQGAWEGQTGTIGWQYEIGGVWANVGSSISPSVMFQNPAGEYTFTQTFTIGSDYNSTFAVRPVFTGDLAATAIIDKLCIAPDDLTTNPGGIGTLPPFDIQCDAKNSPPDAGFINPGPWIYWLWKSMEQYFNCDLMVMLSKMHTLMQQAYRFSQWQMLYWQSLAIQQQKYISASVLPWLGGHLNNIAFGRTTIIQTNTTTGCDNLFCALDGLFTNLFRPMLDAINNLITSLTSLLQPIVDAIANLVNALIGLLSQAGSLIFSLVAALFSLLLSIVAAILNFFSQLIGFFVALVTGINSAEVIPLPGIPACQTSDPRENTLCLGLYALQNTVFADEGQLYIPFIIAIGSLLLMNWAISFFREHLTELLKDL